MMERGIWKPNNVETSVPCPTCPRCGSTNTKFCYYNNYSLTQPRYFCKSCRRYWTKGGSLRNVPVGGGCRRKTTRSSSSTSTSRSVPSKLPIYSNIHASSSSIHHHHVNVTSNIISSCSTTGSLPPPVTQGSDHDNDSIVDDGRPNIDLALVYANFLNPKLPNVAGSSPVLPLPPPPPPLQFSGGPDYNLENENLSTDGNQFYNFDSGINSFDEKQQTSSSTIDHHHQMDCNNDYPLLLPPYMASEEIMVWPSSSDLIISPGDPVINAANYNEDESTTGILPRVQDSNRVDDPDGSGMFHIPNFGTFPGLDDN